MKSRIELREEYINRLRALQYKRRENKQDFLVLALLLVYLTEYLTTGNEMIMRFKAPFILTASVENPKAVITDINEGLNLRGKLAEPLKQFKQINKPTLDTLNTIIPQKPPKINVPKQKRKQLKMDEETDVVEQSNNISLVVNQMVLNKRKKQWNTQRDSKVRRTTFHTLIDRQVVPINEPFRVGDTQAQFPADSSLPPFDRYNCRCYLTFE